MAATTKPAATTLRLDLSKHVPDEMQASDYLSGARSQRDLCDRLHAVFSSLKATPQTPAAKLPPGVDKLAAQLPTRAILQAKDMEVRTLACCCIVELLRIYAPSPPYAPPLLKAAFDAIATVLASQLKLTADDQAVHYDRALHVLRSLVTVRSACILPELAALPLEDGTPAFSDKQIIAFFSGLLDVAASLGAAGDANSGGRATTLQNYIVEAIVAVVEELTDVTTNILACLVVRLLDKASAPSAYIVVANVIHRCEAKLVPALAQMVSASLETAAAIELEEKAAAAVVAAAPASAPKPEAGGSKKGAGRGGASDESTSGGDDDDSSDGSGGDSEEDEDGDGPSRRSRKRRNGAHSSAALGALKALVSPTAALRTRTPRTPEEAAALRLLRRESIYSLICELVVIAPSMLGPAVLVLVPDLEHDTPAVRSGAVTTLGRIFCIDKLISPADAGAASSAPELHTKAPIAVVHAAAFEAWCRRFRDKEPSIRKLVVRLGGELLRIHAQLAPPLAAELASRHSDPDDDVRLQAVTSTCDAACLALKNVPVTLLEATAGRLLDKRPDVRREAATGLAQTAAGHLPGVWTRLAAHAAKHAPAPPSIPSELFKATAEGSSSSATVAPLSPLPPFVPTDTEAEVLAKLAWIPDRVLACYDHPDAEMRLRVVQLLDHILLPDSLSPAARAQGLLALAATLKPRSRQALLRLLSDRQALQGGMSALLQARAAWKKGGEASSPAAAGATANAAAWGALARGADCKGAGGSGSGRGAASAPAPAAVTPAALGKLHAAAATLSGYTGGGPKSHAAFLALALHVADNRVFKYLATLCDPTILPAVAKSTREELFSRLKLASAAGGSVSVPAGAGGAPVTVELKAVSEVTRALVRRITMTTFSILTLPHLLHAVYVAALSGRDDDAAAGLELLQRAAEAFPDTFLTEAEASAIAAPQEAASSTSGSSASGSSVAAPAAPSAWEPAVRPPGVWNYALALLTLPPKGCPAALPLSLLRLFAALGGRLTGVSTANDTGGCLSDKQVKRLREALLALACGRPPAPLAARLTAGVGLAGLAKATRRAVQCALAVFSPALPAPSPSSSAAALPSPDAAPAALVLDPFWAKLDAALFPRQSEASGAAFHLDASSGCNAAELVCRLAAVAALSKAEPVLLERLAGGKAAAPAWQAVLPPLLQLLRSHSVEDDMLDAVIVSSHSASASTGAAGVGKGSRLAPIREERPGNSDDDDEDDEDLPATKRGASTVAAGAGSKRPRDAASDTDDAASSAKRFKSTSGAAVSAPTVSVRIVISAVYKGMPLTSSGYVRALAAEAAGAVLAGQCAAAITLRVSPRPEDTAALGRLVPAVHGACAAVFDAVGKVLGAGGDLCVPRTLQATTLPVTATAAGAAALPPVAAPAAPAAAATASAAKAPTAVPGRRPAAKSKGSGSGGGGGKLGSIVSESEVEETEASGVSDAESVSSRRSGAGSSTARGPGAKRDAGRDAAAALPPGALTEDDAAGIRLACVRVLLSLLSTPVVAPVDLRLVPVPLFLRLAATLLDADARVRHSVLLAFRNGCAPSTTAKPRRLPQLYLALTAAAPEASANAPGSAAASTHPAVAALAADASSPLLPLRYCLLPALAAGCDPKPAIRKEARVTLLQACAAFRLQRLRLAARAARASGGVVTPDAAQAMLLATPELSLSCLLFVLTHDAARFPSEAAWRAFLKTHKAGAAHAPAGSEGSASGPFALQMAALNAALDALLSSASHIPHQLRVGEGKGNAAEAALPLDAPTTAAVVAAAEGGVEAFAATAQSAYGAVPASTTSASLSMLLSLFTRVRDSRDAVAADLTPSLHACADLAFLLAKSRAKDSSAFKPYEGSLPLPVYMFAPAAPASAPAGSKA